MLPAVVRLKVVLVPVCGLTEPDPVPLIFHVTVPLEPETENTWVALTAMVGLEGEMLKVVFPSSVSVLPGMVAVAKKVE